MMNRHKLQMTKNYISKDYTNKELKDMIIELIDSHIEALNKIQTAEGKMDNNVHFNSDSIIASL